MQGVAANAAAESKIMTQSTSPLGLLRPLPLHEGDLVGREESGHGMSFRALHPPSADARSAMSWRR